MDDFEKKKKRTDAEPVETAEAAPSAAVDAGMEVMRSASAAPKFRSDPGEQWEETYKPLIDELTKKYAERDPFSYDYRSDPTYQQYERAYTRNGRRAMQDTLGQTSARTGGLANSYAQVAAQQSYDDYMSALADRIPELEQLAYSMYRDEGNDMLDRINLLHGLEQSDFERYYAQRGLSNQDRAFDYGVQRDTLDRRMDYGRSLVDYGKWQDASAQGWAGLRENARQFDREDAYKYAALAQNAQQFDREDAYKYAALAQNAQQFDREDAYKYAALDQDAQQFWAKVDNDNYWRGIEKMHYDSEWANKLSRQEYDDRLAEAKTAASYGNFDRFRALGFTEDEIRNMRNFAYAAAPAYPGGIGVISSDDSGDDRPADDPWAELADRVTNTKKDGGRMIEIEGAGGRLTLTWAEVQRGLENGTLLTSAPNSRDGRVTIISTDKAYNSATGTRYTIN